MKEERLVWQLEMVRQLGIWIVHRFNKQLTRLTQFWTRIQTVLVFIDDILKVYVTFATHCANKHSSIPN